MTKATWNGVVIAESDSCVVVDGNHYFPMDSVNKAHVQDSETTSVCGWKGTAKYFHVVNGDDVNKDAAWYYPEAKEKAKNLEGHVAFWKGVVVS